MLPYVEKTMPVTWVFQKDNDAKHSLKLVEDRLQDNIVTTFDWPRQSPDFNPMENLWGEIKRGIGKKSFQNTNHYGSLCKKPGTKFPWRHATS